MTKVDTIIVGAGTAGLSALREVRRHTEDFLLVNDGHWGTTCAANGCMPSKALIEVANALHRRHAMDSFGIRGTEALRADIPAVLAHVRKLRDSFVAGPESVPQTLGDRAISGRARLLGPDCITVNGDRIKARAIILAPGSRPIVPTAWTEFGNRVLTTDTLFEQTDLPRRIAVVGMGAIGVELAQALARLGVTVAGFDAAKGLAGIDDAQVLATFQTLLEREMSLHLGAPAELEACDGAIRVTGSGAPFEADAVLAAMGRRPNVDDLGLDTLGVPLDEVGLPELDPTTLRIGELPVFLAGDANTHRALQHEAADDGHIAGRNAAPDARAQSHCRRTPLSIVFASPQIARVGDPISAMQDERIVSAEADFSRQGRARIKAQAEGVLRIHAEVSSARILGAEMCVPGAEHLAHLLSLAIERGLTVSEMLAMPVYHPVLEEGLRGALRHLQKGLPIAAGSDLSGCESIGHDALD
ncbi:MAG: dihydrolipoyl dehydrogenase [Rhodobacteraceae bacterium]|nr:dihydrolipoyl dehydrogenase [Paracoccaceae bacterium]